MRFIIILIVFFPVLHSGILASDVKDSGKSSVSVQGAQQNGPREEALGNLLNKCNTCHATKKAYRYLYQGKYGGFANEIYEQVFVKKKMPKGRKAQLTANETRILDVWIATGLEVKNLP